MKAIVTVKLNKNKNHNPYCKLTGKCPISEKKCTDIFGEHHSYIEEGDYLKDIEKLAKSKWKHITRIEVIE